MARRADAYPENAPGEFFVDRSCIHCGTCFTWAPKTFRDTGSSSVVAQQPAADELARAAQALIACPTNSIGGPAHAAAHAAHTFPVPITERVHFCGYTSPDSFGAWSWLITRPLGNVLVDSPRAAKPLLDRIAGLGGVAMQVLSHIDDVADHEALHRRFGHPRCMHRAEGLAGLERYVGGDDPIPLAPDLLLIPTPGHTAGSMCLLYDNRVLFTGDTLWWDPDVGGLDASQSYCWHDWPTQLRSLEKLLAHDFTWVLPGHGAPHHAATPEAMRADLQRALDHLR